MISVSYTGMVFIFCIINLIGMGLLFWYLKVYILPAILNAKEQSMTDIRSLVPLINIAKDSSLSAKNSCEDMKREISNHANKAGVG